MPQTESASWRRLELYARAFGQLEAIVAEGDTRSAEEKLTALRGVAAWIAEEEKRQDARAAAATSKAIDGMVEKQRRWMEQMDF